MKRWWAILAACFGVLGLGVLGVGGFGFNGAAQAQDGGRVALQLREQVNQGTVGIIAGGVSGTYIRIAADLADVLDREDQTLRVLAILGKGSVQNITDVLYLKGVDVAIVQSDVLRFMENARTHPTIHERIRYITKLYNEEFHLLAGAGISVVEDLAGRKVNFDVKGSGTFMTATTVFESLGIDVEPTHFDQALALEKLKAGEIDALVYVAGKPARLFADVGGDSALHFVPIPPSPALLETYLPGRLRHEDYPALIGDGDAVPTIAVGAVMAVYNWDAQHPRYEKTATFVRGFFDNIAAFRQPPRHPKWQDVNLGAEVPGWQRFAPAEDWLNANRSEPAATEGQ